MKSRLLCDEGQKTIALVFDSDDEVISGLRNYAAEYGLAGCSFTGIGAFSYAMLGYFDYATKSYKQIPIEEQVEVLALTGNIGRYEGDPRIHAHVVLGKSDGTAHGGHLLAAYVRPTLELILVETPDHLLRTSDAETGLPLLSLGPE